MAWFSDYSASPKITIEKGFASGSFSMPGAALDTVKGWNWTRTTEKFVIKALTEDAAFAALQFYKAQDRTTAIMRRVDDSGQFMVEVNKVTSTVEVELAE